MALSRGLFRSTYIYDFAGKLSDVNISKGNVRFAPLMYLEQSLESIDKMPQSNFDEIIEKYVDIKQLLKVALTNKTDDRKIFMKGIKLLLLGV